MRNRYMSDVMYSVEPSSPNVQFEVLWVVFNESRCSPFALMMRHGQEAERTVRGLDDLEMVVTLPHDELYRLARVGDGREANSI